jgi:hypothetical protein
MNTELQTMLADFSVSGDGFIHQLIFVLLVGISAGILYAIGWWFIKRPPIPPIVLTIWQGLFILVGGLIIINFLLGLAGHGFVKW